MKLNRVSKQSYRYCILHILHLQCNPRSKFLCVECGFFSSKYAQDCSLNNYKCRRTKVYTCYNDIVIGSTACYCDIEFYFRKILKKIKKIIISAGLYV